VRARLGNAAVVAGAAGLLRQLAGSDGVKAAVVEAGGLGLITRALAVQAAAPGALEQARAQVPVPGLNSGEPDAHGRNLVTGHLCWGARHCSSAVCKRIRSTSMSASAWTAC